MSANQAGTTAAITVVASTPSSNGGSPILSYNLYRNGSNQPLLSGLTALTYTDSTVTYGVSYTYQYSAVNAIGEGPKAVASNPITATAPVITYTGTYTTTQADFQTKCQRDSGHVPVTRTATSTTSQSDADSKAMAAAILAITCPMSTTYNGTYATTAADYTAKCGSGTSGSTVTRTATSTISQADADQQAKNAAIAAIVCATPFPSYNTTLRSSTPNDPAGEVTLTLSEQNLDGVFKFNASPSGDSTAKSMTVTIGGTFAFLLDFPATYTNTSTGWTFSSNGHRYTGNFTDGTIEATLFD